MQEARGDCRKGGGAWYVENTLPLLDSPNEFYIDLYAQPPLVYFMPNKTLPTDPSAIVEFSVLRNLIEVRGTLAEPVLDLSVSNLKFELTYPTHMDAHEVPSGGDWTVHRGGALFLEYVVRSEVYGNEFQFMGGNAVFVSRYARDIEIRRNSFYALGSSAILMVGDPLFNSSRPVNRVKDENHVERVLVSENVASEIGLVVKQSAGVFLSICRSIFVERNVIFNSARAGIVFNDGFGGNTTIKQNILFNTVMETHDHGPFNVWDRQQWFQNPQVNPTKFPFMFVNNLMLGNSKGPKGVDLDDGARFFEVYDNVLWGALQKFKGNDITVRNNLIFPSEFACVFMTPINKSPANMLFEQNTCISSNDAPYFFNAQKTASRKLCKPSNFIARNNKFIGTGMGKRWTGCGKTLHWRTWKDKFLQDVSTIVSTRLPSPNEQLDLVESYLPFYPK